MILDFEQKKKTKTDPRSTSKILLAQSRALVFFFCVCI